eukprot:GHVT01010602.1.p1 GENE.GHVT01010602.1~~GHVT01010602.1.p1  ORF type:complete len:109 (-),score=10.01 GHVT01010602.1:205-531(-)
MASTGRKRSAEKTGCVVKVLSTSFCRSAAVEGTSESVGFGACKGCCCRNWAGQASYGALLLCVALSYCLRRLIASRDVAGPYTPCSSSSFFFVGPTVITVFLPRSPHY